MERDSQGAGASIMAQSTNAGGFFKKSSIMKRTPPPVSRERGKDDDERGMAASVVQTKRALVLSPEEQEVEIGKRKCYDQVGQLDNLDQESGHEDNPESDRERIIDDDDEKEKEPNRQLFTEITMEVNEMRRIVTGVRKNKKDLTANKCERMEKTLDRIDVLIGRLFGAMADRGRELGSIERKLDIIQEEVKKVGTRDTYASRVGQRKRGGSESEIEVENVRRKEKETETLLIYPKEEGKTSEDVRKKILEKVNPRKAKLHIYRLSRVRGNGVALEVGKEGEGEKVREAVGADLEVRAPKKRMPKCMVHNVPNDYNEGNLIEDMCRQNLGLAEQELERAKSEIKVSFRMKARDQENQHHLILETSPCIYGKIMGGERVFAGWNSFRVTKYVPIMRCYKCQKYGHMAKECHGKEVCGHCSDEGHDRRQCPKARLEPTCANCPKGKNRHSVHSRDCPVHQKEVQRIEKNTDYGE